jgi:hypothetical protein
MAPMTRRFVALWLGIPLAAAAVLSATLSAFDAPEWLVLTTGLAIVGSATFHVVFTAASDRGHPGASDTPIREDTGLDPISDPAAGQATTATSPPSFAPLPAYAEHRRDQQLRRELARHQRLVAKSARDLQAYLDETARRTGTGIEVSPETDTGEEDEGRQPQTTERRRDDPPSRGGKV